MEQLLPSNTTVVFPGNSKSAVSFGEYTTGKKYVGLYFSASWCPPCRVFTPVISALPESSSVSFVYVTCDNSKAAFEEYHGKMSFAGLTYEDAELREALGDALGIRGIPSVIFVDLATGAVLTTDGRELVGSANGDVSVIEKRLDILRSQKNIAA